VLTPHKVTSCPTQRLLMANLRHASNPHSPILFCLSGQEWSFTQPGADEVDRRVAIGPQHTVPPYQSMRAPAGSTAALQASHWGIAHPEQPDVPLPADPEKVTMKSGTGLDSMTPAGVVTQGPSEWSFTQPGADEVDRRVAIGPQHTVPPYQSMRAPAGSTAALQASHWGIAHPEPGQNPIAVPPTHYHPATDNKDQPEWWG
jgi:hypothetical protein